MEETDNFDVNCTQISWNQLKKSPINSNDIWKNDVSEKSIHENLQKKSRVIFLPAKIMLINKQKISNNYTDNTKKNKVHMNK